MSKEIVHEASDYIRLRGRKAEFVDERKTTNWYTALLRLS